MALAPVPEKRDFIPHRLRAYSRKLFAECRQLYNEFLSSRSATTATAIFVALFPVALALRVMRHNRTSVPYGDDWYTPGAQIISLLNGTLQFADLFQQHNESRPVFPRLCYLFLFRTSGRWDPKDAMMLTFALACVGSLLLYQLLRCTTSFTFRSRVLACALLNAIFFCPPQYEHFLWSILLVSFIPGVALLAALLINLSDLRLPWKVLTNSILAFIATYTFANGMLLWLLAAPICLNRQRTAAENRLNSVLCYVVYFLCATLAISFYFHHYVHPAHHPAFATSFGDAWPLLRFFLTWVGNAFVMPGADPLFFGCFFMAAFILLLLIATKVARRQRTFRQFYSWVIIALYALASGAVIAFGRMRFGMGPASAPKYIPESVFFYVGLAGLGLTLWDSRRIANDALDVRLVFVAGLAAGIFAAGWLASLNKELARIDLIHQERKDLALAVKWIPAIPSNPDLALSKVPSKVVVEKSIALSKYDALRPRFIPQSLASAVRQNPIQEDSSVGMLESARFGTDHHLLLTGIAWLPYRNSRADCVVVGYTNSDGGLTPFTVLEPTNMRVKLRGSFDLKRLPPNGFAALIDPANLPTGTLTLRAVAADLKAEGTLPMAGVLSVRNEPVHNN